MVILGNYSINPPALLCSAPVLRESSTIPSNDSNSLTEAPHRLCEGNDESRLRASCVQSTFMETRGTEVGTREFPHYWCSTTGGSGRCLETPVTNFEDGGEGVSRGNLSGLRFCKGFTLISQCLQIKCSPLLLTWLSPFGNSPLLPKENCISCK